MSTYRFLVSPRWLAVHALVWLIMIPAFVWLAGWQERGFYHHLTLDNEISHATRAKPAPLSQRDSVGGEVTAVQQWRDVTVTGRYDTAEQMYVRQRENGGTLGFYVLTPLVLRNGDAVLVNRGWVAQGQDPLRDPVTPPPPSGTVTVLGRLYPSETHASSGIRDESNLPGRQVMLMNSTILGPRVSHPLYGGFVAALSQRPAPRQALPAQPAPQPGDPPWLYLVYWIQWWLFAVVAVGGWLGAIRQSVRIRRAEAAEVEPGFEPMPERGVEEARPAPPAEKPRSQRPAATRELRTWHDTPRSKSAATPVHVIEIDRDNASAD